MKFISCYIAGFGKFRNVTFDLSKGIVQIKSENGFGKTTLAYFLQAMLFGMENGRNKGVSDNLRLRFAPFYGGAYGGSLRFLYAGEEYRIERTFGKTQGHDTATLYDKNNMRSFAFGEQVERLGELVLGVNRESYERTAFIPQEDRTQTEISGDLKSKLIAVLTQDDKNHGVQTAIEKLDVAERTLRAKRRPAKGKLDEMEERFSAILQHRQSLLDLKQDGEKSKIKLQEIAIQLEEITTEIAKLNQQLQTLASIKQREVSRVALNELKSNLSNMQNRLDELKKFFGDVDPTHLNVDGFERAVNDYYVLQQNSENQKAKSIELESLCQQEEGIQIKFDAVKKTLDSFEKMLESESKEQRKGGSSTKEQKKKYQKRKTYGWVGIFTGFLILLTGGILFDVLPALAYFCFGFGGISFFIGAGLMLSIPSEKAKHKPLIKFSDPLLNKEYDNAQKEYQELRFQLSAFPENLKDIRLALQTEIQKTQEKMQALKQGLDGFINKFSLGEIYDYRSGLTLLKERREEYVTLLNRKNEGDAKLSEFSVEDAEELPITDGVTLTQKKVALESERDRLLGEKATLSAKVETMPTVIEKLQLLDGEEQVLKEEYERLTHRLLAIQTAKKLILSAGENLASKYLDAVQTSCREYAKVLNGLQSLHFSADGNLLCEEEGSLHALEYYSVGLRDLAGFCVRVALCEAVYKKEKPVLILDDPFVNLDDDKLERAKGLVNQLAKKFQIIYFTCKKERGL